MAKQLWIGYLKLKRLTCGLIIAKRYAYALRIHTVLKYVVQCLQTTQFVVFRLHNCFPIYSMPYVTIMLQVYSLHKIFSKNFKMYISSFGDIHSTHREVSIFTCLRWLC